MYVVGYVNFAVILKIYNFADRGTPGKGVMTSLPILLSMHGGVLESILQTLTLMNEIKEIFPYSSRTVSVKIDNPTVARKAQPGNFVVIRFSDDGVRLPFSIVDTDPEHGTVEIIIHRAEGLDNILQLIKPGTELPDLLGPLGRPAKIDCGKRVLCCGDGAGFVPLLPIVRALHQNGCEVISVMSERSDKTTCLSDEIENFSDRVILAKDLPLEVVVEKAIDEFKIEKLWLSGPTMMMKEIAAIAERRDLPADCVLNMIMIDGIGLCGTCRVTVGGELKHTCQDGPVFDARKVDFDQLFNRQRLFE